MSDNDSDININDADDALIDKRIPKKSKAIIAQVTATKDFAKQIYNTAYISQSDEEAQFYQVTNDKEEKEAKRLTELKIQEESQSPGKKVKLNEDYPCASTSGAACSPTLEWVSSIATAVPEAQHSPSAGQETEVMCDDVMSTSDETGRVNNPRREVVATTSYPEVIGEVVASPTRMRARRVSEPELEAAAAKSPAIIEIESSDDEANTSVAVRSEPAPPANSAPAVDTEPITKLSRIFGMHVEEQPSTSPRPTRWYKETNGSAGCEATQVAGPNRPRVIVSKEETDAAEALTDLRESDPYLVKCRQLMLKDNQRRLKEQMLNNNGNKVLLPSSGSGCRKRRNISSSGGQDSAILIDEIDGNREEPILIDDEDSDSSGGSSDSGITDLSKLTINQRSLLLRMYMYKYDINSSATFFLNHLRVLGFTSREVFNEYCGKFDIPEYTPDMMIWESVLRHFHALRPRRKLKEFNSIEHAIYLIRTARNIIVLTGAGVSVSCGIPDFRSEDGIYARLSKEYPDLPNPTAMFDMKFFLTNPKPFFQFAREIYPGNFTPSFCHRFIAQLETEGKLLRNYTQNIDTLEQAAGIRNVMQCHGSFATATCIKCKHMVSSEDIRDDIFARKIPLCKICGDGIIKPDIVFFGEDLDDEYYKMIRRDKKNCDLFICIGSSMKVRPVSLIPNLLKREIPQILINRENLPNLNFDVRLLGNADHIVNQICLFLGDNFAKIADMPSQEMDTEFDFKTTKHYARYQEASASITIDSSDDSSDDSDGDAIDDKAVVASFTAVSSRIAAAASANAEKLAATTTSTPPPPPSTAKGSDQEASTSEGLKASTSRASTPAPSEPLPIPPKVNDNADTFNRCELSSSSSSGDASDTNYYEDPASNRKGDNIADDIPANTFMRIPPNTYLFKGALVYENELARFQKVPRPSTDSSSDSGDSDDDSQQEDNFYDTSSNENNARSSTYDSDVQEIQPSYDDDVAEVIVIDDDEEEEVEVLEVLEEGKERRANKDTSENMETGTSVGVEDDKDVSVKEDNDVSVKDVSVKEDEDVSCKEDNDVSVKEDNNVSVKEDNNVSVKEDNNVSVKEDNDVSVKEDNDVSVKEDKDISGEEDKDISVEEDNDISAEENKDVSSEEDKDLSASREENKDVSSMEDKAVSGELDNDISNEEDKDVSVSSVEDKDVSDDEYKSVSGEQDKSVSNEEGKSVSNEEGKSVSGEEGKSVSNEEGKSVSGEEGKTESLEEGSEGSNEGCSNRIDFNASMFSEISMDSVLTITSDESGDDSIKITVVEEDKRGTCAYDGDKSKEIDSLQD